MATPAKKTTTVGPGVMAVDSTPALTLDNLRPGLGAQKDKVRKGRGRASGAGKTCNRGHNGEGQRSGRSSKRGFEGGQMPGYRRFPKLDGFRNLNDREWLELNLNQLAGFASTDITLDMMIESRVLKRRHSGVRILGGGECPKGVTVQAHYVTPSALEKITAAGGKVELISFVASEEVSAN